jgi:hypothetical protein
MDSQMLYEEWKKGYEVGHEAGYTLALNECQRGAEDVADQLATLTAIEEMLARLGLDAQEFLALRWEEQEKLASAITIIKYAVYTR